MTRRSTCVSSALRGVAFGAAFGAAFWTALLISARFAEPTAQPERASCPQAVRAEAASRGPSLTKSDGAASEQSAPEVKVYQERRDAALTESPGGSAGAARSPGSSKTGALAQRARSPSGGAAPVPIHIPRRDPPRLPESRAPAPSAGLAASDLQQLTALLAQLTQGTGGEAPSPELLQKLLGGLGANAGEGVSPALLQQLLGAHGAGTPPDLGL